MNKKRLNWLILIYMLLLFISVAAQQDKKPMTNDDIIKMVKAGLPESTIVLAIQKGPNKFDTSPDALIALKEAGATQKVLDAILQNKIEPISVTQEPPQYQTTFQRNELLGTWECFEASDEYKKGSGKIPPSSRSTFLAKFSNSEVYESAGPEDRFFTSPTSVLNWKYTVQSDKSGVYELIYRSRIAARCRVKWIDVNTFEDEILFSNEPGYVGIKRVFRRIK